MQTSESFRLSALLSLSGGFQDAYTYNVRGHVFANAQTGNVVLMSQSLMQGDLAGAARYMLPLLAFGAGIFAAERIETAFKAKKRFHWRQLVVLLEMAVLSAVGLMPLRWNLAANMLVSFSCAMQVQAFRKVHGYGYASTMCIGNLRSGTESLSVYLRGREKGALTKALHYYGILLVFAIGAGLGGVLSQPLGIHAIWLSVAMLLGAELMMARPE